MEKFISKATLSRCFAYEGDFGVVNIGYHNFKRLYNPAHSSRVQNFYTWHFVLTGKGQLKTGGKTYNIKSGQMFFLPPATEICYFPDEDEPWEYVWFAIKGDICAYYGELLGFDTPVKQSENFNQIKYLLKECFAELEQGGGYFGVLSAFYKLMQICTVTKSYVGIEGVKRIIDEGFTRNNFSIEALCTDVGISHPHLLRLFKKKYHITLIKYLNKKRIEYACRLLIVSDLTVKSVAFSCGFSDELHFMKTFKSHTGKSALQYKKENASNSFVSEDLIEPKEVNRSKSGDPDWRLN